MILSHVRLPIPPHRLFYLGSSLRTEIYHNTLFFELQVLFSIFYLFYQFFSNFKAIKRRIVIRRRLCSPDHLYTSVFFQQKFCRFQFAIIVISHCKSVCTSIMDIKQISSIDLWKHAINRKFIIIFTERSRHIILMVTWRILFSDRKSVV